jgi:ankyrin repeat protein
MSKDERMNNSDICLSWHCCFAFLAVIVLTGCGSEQIAEVDKSDGKVAKAKPKPTESLTRISNDAFRLAAYEGNIETVRNAIKSGADVNAAAPVKSLTALHMAAYNGHSEIVKLLLEHGATIDCRDDEGKTPLIHACTGPFAKTVEILLDAGADVNAKDSTEAFTPLMMGAGLGQTEVVKVLLRHNADKSMLDDDDESALDHARNSGHTGIVELLGQ